jgi:glycosidase
LIETLKRISRVADGVRCDMAMLVLSDYFRQLWYPLAPESWFADQMPQEFWQEAIREVKAERPDFKFIAEAYWDTEKYLIELGFDMVYEKKLYDGLVSRNLYLVHERLVRPTEILNRSLHFIENHDEPRAAAVFSRENNLAGLALTLSLPGSSLLYEGQMEGKRERLPVQRLKPLEDEPVDQALKQSYRQILKLTANDIFTKGSFHLFNTGLHGVVSFYRKHSGRIIAYLGQMSETPHTLSSTPLDLSALAHAAGAQNYLLLTNLLTSASMIVEGNNGAFHARLDHLGVNPEAAFSLLEATAPK